MGHLSRQHISLWHYSLSAISQLLLTRFWGLNFCGPHIFFWSKLLLTQIFAGQKFVSDPNLVNGQQIFQSKMFSNNIFSLIFLKQPFFGPPFFWPTFFPKKHFCPIIFQTQISFLIKKFLWQIILLHLDILLSQNFFVTY